MAQLRLFEPRPAEKRRNTDADTLVPLFTFSIHIQARPKVCFVSPFRHTTPDEVTTMEFGRYFTLKIRWDMGLGTRMADTGRSIYFKHSSWHYKQSCCRSLGTLQRETLCFEYARCLDLDGQKWMGGFYRCLKDYSKYHSLSWQGRCIQIVYGNLPPSIQMPYMKHGVLLEPTDRNSTAARTNLCQTSYPAPIPIPWLYAKKHQVSVMLD